MLYTAVFTKKKRLLQKAYVIDKDTIYITDTPRAKRKFLKSGIRNVIFTHDMEHDATFGGLLKPLSGYDEDFLYDYLEGMVEHLVSFLKPELPLEAVAVSSIKTAEIGAKYAKTVFVTDKGEDTLLDGVNIICTKRLKRMPDMVIKTQGGIFPYLPNVPTVDITEKPACGRYCLSWKSMSFKCALLPYEISAESLMYLLEIRGDFEYSLTSYRKKCPVLFTFL